MNLVAKRLETRTTDFFVPVAAGIEGQVVKIRAEHSGGRGLGRFLGRKGDRG